MYMIVANSDQLVSNGISKRITRSLRGEVYNANVVVVHLRSCEMILGVQWLTTLGLFRGILSNSGWSSNMMTYMTLYKAVERNAQFFLYRCNQVTQKL